MGSDPERGDPWEKAHQRRKEKHECPPRCHRDKPWRIQVHTRHEKENAEKTVKQEEEEEEEAQNRNPLKQEKQASRGQPKEESRNPEEERTDSPQEDDPKEA